MRFRAPERGRASARGLQFAGMCTCVILFAKLPVPGEVKTRLQPRLSASQAADLYRSFLLDCAAAAAATTAARKVMAYSPAGAAEAIREMLGSPAVAFDFIPQPDTDLGNRMEVLFEHSFARGAERTVIVGSDSPSLGPERIDEAFDLLRSRELVLGPSSDGGYYLIGQRQLQRALFRGIEWSSSRVFRQTLEAAAGLDLALLPPWYDVDTAADAAFLRDHLEALERTGRRWGFRSLQQLRALDL